MNVRSVGAACQLTGKRCHGLDDVSEELATIRLQLSLSFTCTIGFLHHEHMFRGSKNAAHPYSSFVACPDNLSQVHIALPPDQDGPFIKRHEQDAD